MLNEEIFIVTLLFCFLGGAQTKWNSRYTRGAPRYRNLDEKDEFIASVNDYKTGYTRDELFSHVVVATGIFNTPNLPKFPVNKVLMVSNGGDWGAWGDVKYCDEQTYAVGFKMKIESYQGDEDDSSLNGIQLICQGLEGGATNNITSTTGPDGTWRDETFCEHRGGQKQFLISFRLKVEEYSLINDDTAANGVQFKCRGLNNFEGSHTINDDKNVPNWGEYGSWSDSCGLSSVICGIVTRLEEAGSADDTALNDVKFVCCQYY